VRTGKPQIVPAAHRVSTVLESIHMEFDLARVDLAQARLAQQSNDTLVARSRVPCRSRVDALLDMWNATQARPS
jgi:hypothetical protein